MIVAGFAVQDCPILRPESGKSENVVDRRKQMPCNYTIDTTNRIAYFSHSGTITLDEVYNRYTRFYHDPHAITCDCIITDLTDTDIARISGVEIARLAVTIDSYLDRLSQMTIAYIAPQDLQYGTIRVWLATIGEGLFKNAGVFRSTVEARTWLAGVHTSAGRREQATGAPGRNQNHAML
jgi:hypothetical protein